MRLPFKRLYYLHEIYFLNWLFDLYVFSQKSQSLFCCAFIINKADGVKWLNDLDFAVKVAGNQMRARKHLLQSRAFSRRLEAQKLMKSCLWMKQPACCEWNVKLVPQPLKLLEGNMSHAAWSTIKASCSSISVSSESCDQFLIYSRDNSSTGWRTTLGSACGSSLAFVPETKLQTDKHRL